MIRKEIYYLIIGLMFGLIFFVGLVIATTAAALSTAAESSGASADKIARSIDMTSSYPDEHTEYIKLPKDQAVIIRDGIVIVKNTKNTGDFATSVIFHIPFTVFGENADDELIPDDGYICIKKAGAGVIICGREDGCC